MRCRTRAICTLDAAEILSACIAADYSMPAFSLDAQDLFESSAVLLRTDAHPWCPLFDQLGFCLRGHVSDLASREALRPWFLYVDFSSLANEIEHSERFLESAYGKALRVLVEQGFSIEDARGRKWHYAVFDKSASQARKSVISFLANEGWGDDGAPVKIYEELTRRLCLDIDFSRLSKEFPADISWNKHFAYRGLYLTTAWRTDCELTKEKVLVLNANPDGPLRIPCDVVKAEGEALTASGNVTARFVRKDAEDGGSVASSLFDGEGLVAPELAASMRASLSGESADRRGNHGTFETSSFQIRMPFAKGIVHEVDFHAFAEETLGLASEDCADLMIEDAYGVSRRWGDVQLILTTDMLKCHRWLDDWLKVAPDRTDEFDYEDRILDPMAYYFAKFDEYDHALYIIRKRAKGDENGLIETNYQVLSTLDIAPEDFDSFVRAHMEKAFSALESAQTARDFLLQADGLRELSRMQAREEDETIWSLVEDEDMASGESTSPSSWKHALSQDERFVFDRFIRMALKDKVNSRLIDCAVGKIPVPGTLRIFSHDLLPFLVMLMDMLVNGKPESLGSYQERRDELLAEAIDVDETYLPHYDAQLNDCGYLAVFRNPHLSRSEQCALKPIKPGDNSVRKRYLGHLGDVCMVSTASVIPMVLGGADFDGDKVHVFNDETIVSAVISGAYEREADGALRRKFPVANLDSSDLLGSLESAPCADARSDDLDAVGAHVNCLQLLKSFQSNVGKLSNAAVRLGAVLYGHGPGREAGEAPMLEDACAYYTIAVGADIDSIKTGVALDLANLAIDPRSKRISKFGVEGLQVSEPLSFLHFKNGVRALRESRRAVWECETLEADPDTATLRLFMTESNRKSGTPSAVAIDPEGRLDANPMLKGVALSNLQRLPWLLLTEARKMADRSEATVIDASEGSPLDESYSDFLDRPEESHTRYMELKALVKAAQRALRTLKAYESAVLRASKSNAFGLARRIAQAYPTAYPQQEVEEILRAAVRKIQAATTRDGYDRILERFEKDGFERWALCPAAARRERLSEFLPNVDFDERFFTLIEDDGLPEGSAIPHYLTLAARDAAVATSAEVAVKSRARSGDHDETHDEDDVLAAFKYEADAIYEELMGEVNRSLAQRLGKEQLMTRLAKTLKERMLDRLLIRDNLAIILTYLRDECQCFPAKFHNANALYWELIDCADIDEFLSELNKRPALTDAPA